MKVDGEPSAGSTKTMSVGWRRGVSIDRKSRGSRRILRDRVDRTTLEEQQLSRCEGSFVRLAAHPEGTLAGEHEEVFVAGRMIVCRHRPVDTKDPGAGRVAIGEVGVGEHCGRRSGQRCCHGHDIEATCGACGFLRAHGRATA